MRLIAAQLREKIELKNLDARFQCPGDFPHAIDDDPPLLVAARAIAQPDRGFDAGIVNARDGRTSHRHGPSRPNSQHSQATGPAISGASMISSTPPRPRSQVLLSFRSMSRLSSDSARSPTMPASANSRP